MISSSRDRQLTLTQTFSSVLPQKHLSWPHTTKRAPFLPARSRPQSASSCPVNLRSTLFLRVPRLSPSTLRRRNKCLYVSALFVFWAWGFLLWHDETWPKLHRVPTFRESHNALRMVCFLLGGKCLCTHGSGFAVVQYTLPIVLSE